MHSPNRPDRDSDRWFTPQELVDGIANELGLRFGLDPASEDGAEKAPNYFTPAMDGLAQDWVAAAGRRAIWLNPPYSSPGPWLEKAADAAAAGVPVVALLRASLDTYWWHSAVPSASRVWALRGRVRFERPDGNSPGPANHASTVVIWLPDHTGDTILEHKVTSELCEDDDDEDDLPQAA